MRKRQFLEVQPQCYLKGCFLGIHKARGYANRTVYLGNFHTHEHSKGKRDDDDTRKTKNHNCIIIIIIIIIILII